MKRKNRTKAAGSENPSAATAATPMTAYTKRVVTAWDTLGNLGFMALDALGYRKNSRQWKEWTARYLTAQVRDYDTEKMSADERTASLFEPIARMHNFWGDLRQKHGEAFPVFYHNLLFTIIYEFRP